MVKEDDGEWDTHCVQQVRSKVYGGEACSEDGAGLFLFSDFGGNWLLGLSYDADKIVEGLVNVDPVFGTGLDVFDLQGREGERGGEGEGERKKQSSIHIRQYNSVIKLLYLQF